MARRNTKRDEEVQSGSIIAMIDVVFQLIIFFVCTVSMQQVPLTDRIKLPMAPHGDPITDVSKYEFRINVDDNGIVGLSGDIVDENTLSAMLSKTMIQSGLGNKLPVVIRADARAKHRAVRKVMDACTRVGISKIRFVAIQKAVQK